MENPPPTPDPTPPAPPAPTPPAPDPKLAELQATNARLVREAALATARADFPNADRAILDMFQGSAEDLRKLAESLHTKETERLAVVSRQPGPPIVPGPGGSPNPGDLERARYAELARKVQMKVADPIEVEEFSSMAFARLYNQHMVDRKSGGSSSSGEVHKEMQVG